MSIYFIQLAKLSDDRLVLTTIFVYLCLYLLSLLILFSYSCVNTYPQLKGVF